MAAHVLNRLHVMPGFAMRSTKYLHWIGILVLGLCLPMLMYSPYSWKGPRFLSGLVFSVILTGLVWGGNMFIVKRMHATRDWNSGLFRRLTIQTFVCVIFTVLVVLALCVTAKNTTWNPYLHGGQVRGTLALSVTITLALNALYEARTLARRWRFSFMRNEVLKREGLRAEYESLKHQVNPHFLFRSLNTLSQLIETDTHLANHYVQELASVYRYVLQTKDIRTVSLAKERQFVEMYIFLLSARLGGLIVHWELDSDAHDLHIPPLTLQILVENAVKYNLTSPDAPLQVYITTIGSSLVVYNALNPRPTIEEYTKIGLKNIRERYSTLTSRPVDVIKTEEGFTVQVPMLPTPRYSA